MPYSGEQAEACYAQAEACLSHGYTPRWECKDWFKEAWSNYNSETNIIYSSGYIDHCGPPLSVEQPTSINEAEEKLGIEKKISKFYYY